MKILYKIAETIYRIFATGIITVGISLLILYCIGIRPYAVRSGSMEPEIEIGSICFVNHNISYSDIEIGDIIAFKLSNHTMVTHRVTDKTEDGFITKGDNNNVEDAAMITENEYVGKTIYWIPKAGYAVMFLHTRRGLIVCSCIFLMFFLTGFLFHDDEEGGKKI